MSGLIRIEIACSSNDEAANIARSLLKARLVACTQTQPMTSRYHWQGAIEQSDEILLVAKTRAALFQDVAKLVIRLHSYDVPEIMATEIVHVSEAYADWVRTETGC